MNDSAWTGTHTDRQNIFMYAARSIEPPLNGSAQLDCIHGKETLPGPPALLSWADGINAPCALLLLPISFDAPIYFECNQSGPSELLLTVTCLLCSSLDEGIVLMCTGAALVIS
jgi:hypothetical protein